jgi:transposase
MHSLQEFVRLHRQGRGAREVARLLGMSPNTERRYRRLLEAACLLAGNPDELPELSELRAVVGSGQRHQETSSIAQWTEPIAKRLKTGAGPRAIHDWLRVNEPEFKGSYWSVKRLCRQLRKGEPAKAADVVIRVETRPGQIGQVDFGYVGKLFDPCSGKTRKAWVFVMVLGYSRHLFAKVVFDQKASTWVRLHVEAFAFFGGVPAVIVPDNLKAAMIRAAFGVSENPSLNRSYRELARYYGFVVDPTPPYAPQKKGKVESAVHYVKRNFFTAWQPIDIDEANKGLARWNQEVAGIRTHGTTGQQPVAMFEHEEQPTLRALPAQAFDPVLWKKAKVHRDSHIQFERRIYSVPWQHMGKTVWVQATSKTVAIYVNEERVATHPRKGRQRVQTNPAHLPTVRLAMAERGLGYWEERAQMLGEPVLELIQAVVADDEVLLNLRAVQAIVLLLEQHPKQRAHRACKRALYFGNLTYKGIKDILRKGLDMQPLPNERPTFGHLNTPTFARSVQEIVC